jgi:hypothetical protein
VTRRKYGPSLETVEAHLTVLRRDRDAAQRIIDAKQAKQNEVLAEITKYELLRDERMSARKVSK